MIVPGMVWLLIWKYFFDPSFGILNKILNATGIMSLLQGIDSIFGWNIFVEGIDPAWLGREELIVPALIIWGFPWVGVVGVLIYLAGLGQIGTEVYESAEVDGAGSLTKLFHIELPLIMTQVRLNQVLMIINTLRAYGLVLVLLGDAGGPGGAGMVPGLYMFRKAFIDQEAGYACAIGLLIFFLILTLTLINNRYVRVEK
jgi:raffinose/stachyose/melibiose transport system permease protein